MPYKDKNVKDFKGFLWVIFGLSFLSTCYFRPDSFILLDIIPFSLSVFAIFCVLRARLIPYIYGRFRYPIYWIFLAIVAVDVVHLLAGTGLSFWTGAMEWDDDVFIEIDNLVEIAAFYAVAGIYAFVFYYVSVGEDYFVKTIAARKELRVLRKELRQESAEMIRVRDIIARRSLSPHFLKNTLSVIAGLIQHNPTLARIASDHTTTILLYYLKKQEVPTISLGKELEQVDNLLTIYTIRQGSPVWYSCCIAPDVSLKRRVSPMLFINLIENACEYGVTNDPDKPIRLHVKMLSSKRVEITIRNAVSSKSQYKRLSSKKGIQLVRDRLLALNSANSIHTSLTDSVFTVTIVIVYK